MDNTQYAFSVASIRVKESALFGQTEMEQLLAIPTYAAALSFLAEALTKTPSSVLLALSIKISRCVTWPAVTSISVISLGW